MKHICAVEFENYTFGVSIDKSIDTPGMFRLVCDEDGQEIYDGCETEKEAIEAIYSLYAYYPIEWEYEGEYEWGIEE